jgi:hypothetical protein
MAELTIHQKINVRSSAYIERWRYQHQDEELDVTEEVRKRAGWLSSFYFPNMDAYCTTCWEQGFGCQCPVYEHCNECNSGKKIVDGGSNWGFCGPIYYTKLECGHFNVDASNDVPTP